MIRSVLGVLVLGLTVGAAQAADLRYGYEYGPPPPAPRYGYEERAPLPAPGPRYGYEEQAPRPTPRPRYGYDPDLDRSRYARPVQPEPQDDEDETELAEARPLPPRPRPACFERRTPWGPEEVCR
jgi:hypothetical protein